jgi:hypothetical protein
MVAYCTNTSQCRRQTFSDAFGTSEASLSSSSSAQRLASFQRCGSMCDNCLQSRGRGGRTGTGGEEPPRHIFNSDRPVADGLWTQKRSSQEKKRPSPSFTTASGKKIQPSIIHLEEGDAEERRRGGDHKRRRASGDNEEEVMIRAGAASDSEDGMLSTPSVMHTNRSSSAGGSRGQKLFQSAKEALVESTKLFVSNQTPRGLMDTLGRRRKSSQPSGHSDRREEEQEVQFIE